MVLEMRCRAANSFVWLVERCGLVEAIQKLVGAAGWRIDCVLDRVQQRLNLILVGRLGLSGAVDGRGGGVGV
jgi:hypothetical protein